MEVLELVKVVQESSATCVGRQNSKKFLSTISDFDKKSNFEIILLFTIYHGLSEFLGHPQYQQQQKVYNVVLNYFFVSFPHFSKIQSLV